MAIDAYGGFIVEPDLDIFMYQSVGVSDSNNGRYKDPVLDDLYARQARASDPEERKKLLRAFERRRWRSEEARSPRRPPDVIDAFASLPVARR